MANFRDVPRDNPAGRLYHLLSEANQKGAGNQFGDAWAKVFGVDTEDQGRVLTLLAQVILEVDRGKEAVQTNPEINQELYLRPFEELEKAFNLINYGKSWKSWSNRLQDDTLTKLAYCANELSRVQPEGTISDDDLAELRSQLEEVLDFVLEAEIDDALKQVLVDGLETLRRAILEYKIRGAAGLREALERNYGMLMLHGHEIGKDAEAKKTGKKIFGFLQRVHSTLEIIWKVRQLTSPPVEEAITKLLGSGGG